VVTDGELRLENSKVVLDDSHKFADFPIITLLQLLALSGSDPKGAEPFPEVGRSRKSPLFVD
jgi:hypothetical protein